MPAFWRHAIPSKLQAEAADGNIQASTTYRNGIMHTLTVWQDRKSMTRYMVSGAHAKAMKVIKDISNPGGTKIYGYESETIPTWDEALALWDEHGKLHGIKPIKDDPRTQSQPSSTTLAHDIEKVRFPFLTNGDARSILSFSIALLLVAFWFKK